MAKFFQFIIVVIFLVISTNFANNKEGKFKKGSSLGKTNGTPSRIQLNINNISTWFANNGDSDISPSGNSGFFFPKGSGKTAMFESGLVWGATLNGERRVGGSTYNQGLLPGRIIGSGESAVREDETLEHVRIYRVRRNFIDVSAEVNDGEGSDAEIITKYEKDWNEWPTQNGAPFEDIDGDGNYNPTVDIPGVIGADQTIWYVANDLDTATCKGLYGSDPMGVEMQATFWGYDRLDSFGDVIFRKYKIINKSNSGFDSMFVSLWADPDIGNLGDDFSGCDTTLSLMYSYNGDEEDRDYGITPPAVGFDFFQGPIVSGEVTDTAIFNNQKKPGFRNLQMSVHYLFEDGFNSPQLNNYIGTLEFHNLFRGKISSTGEPFKDPNTGLETKFMLSGDPISETGWVDGIIFPPGERIHGMVAGPFTMEPGDTQEVVVGEIGAFGENNLDAITKLKEVDYYLQNEYNNLLNVETNPNPPSIVGNFIEENEEAFLRWEQSSEVESFDFDGYQFQGYNIYQFQGPGDYQVYSAKKLITFDIVDGIDTISQLVYNPTLGYETLQEIQTGSDSGLEYEFKIEKDYLTDSKLLIGKSYFFGVTSYTYTFDESKKIKTSESNMKIVEMIYRDSEEGVKYGENISLIQTSGSGDSKLIILSIYDASQISGEKYTISFFKETDTSSANYNNLLWKLTKENGTVILDSVSLGLVDGFIVDGFMIKVNQSSPGFNDWSDEGTRWISGVNWGGQVFFGGLDNGFNFFGSEITEGSDFMDVQMRWAGVNNFDGAVDKSAKALALKSQSEQPEFWSKGKSYSRDLGYAVSGVADIPFAVYDMETNPSRRLNVCIVEDANDGVANLLWDMGWDGSAFAGNGGREYIFIMNSDYNEGVDYDDTNWGPAADVLYSIWPQERDSHKYLESDFRMNIFAIKSITENDIFEFYSDITTFVNNGDKLPIDYSLSQNYPNPFNPSTTIRYTLPISDAINTASTTKIIIYDILGREVVTLVNKVQKAGRYEVQFDASNFSSGVYIYRLQSGSFVKSRKMILIK